MSAVLFVLLGAGYGAVMGASLASFACVVAERGAAGLPLTGRSVCACGRQLRLSENVPVLGWLRARGVASCCQVKLPARYLWWELALAGYGAAGGALVWWLWWHSGGSAEAVAGVVAGAGALLTWCGWHRSPAPGGPGGPTDPGGR